MKEQSGPAQKTTKKATQGTIGSHLQCSSRQIDQRIGSAGKGRWGRPAGDEVGSQG